MGSVWKAKHVLTGRAVAVKVLDARFLANPLVVQRFGREARAAGAIQHPGIVEVLDLDQTAEGIPFLVMEYLEGESLADRLDRCERLSEVELRHVARQLLDALEAAHSQGVVHRDIKPENIHILAGGRDGERVKLLDFGISSKADEALYKLTQTGSVLGTPHYMSPEQARGDTELDHRIDLYAVGVVLYECVVGEVPFDAPNYNRLIRMIIEAEAVAPSKRGATISEHLERLIMWALEKEPALRVHSAEAMLDWLERTERGEHVPWSSEGVDDAKTELQEPWRFGPRQLDASPLPSEETLGFSSVPPPPSDAALATAAAGSLESLAKATPLELDDDALYARASRPSERPMRSAISVSDVKESGFPEAKKPASRRPPRNSPTRSVPPAVGMPLSVRVANEEPPWKRYFRRGAIFLVGFLIFVFGVRYLVASSSSVAEEEELLAGANASTEAPELERPRESAFANRWANVTLTGLPPNAVVSVDGIPASNPLRLLRDHDHVLLIQAPGYQERRLELRVTGDQALHAGMEPAPTRRSRRRR